MCIMLYVYIYIYIYIAVYIYIYIERERETSIPMHIYIYIYIYIHTHEHGARDRKVTKPSAWKTVAGLRTLGTAPARFLSHANFNIPKCNTYQIHYI